MQIDVYYKIVRLKCVFIFIIIAIPSAAVVALKRNLVWTFLKLAKYKVIWNGIYYLQLEN